MGTFWETTHIGVKPQQHEQIRADRSRSDRNWSGRIRSDKIIQYFPQIRPNHNLAHVIRSVLLRFGTEYLEIVRSFVKPWRTVWNHNNMIRSDRINTQDQTSSDNIWPNYNIASDQIRSDQIRSNLMRSAPTCLGPKYLGLVGDQLRNGGKKVWNQNRMIRSGHIRSTQIRSDWRCTDVLGDNILKSSGGSFMTPWKKCVKPQQRDQIRSGQIGSDEIRSDEKCTHLLRHKLLGLAGGRFWNQEKYMWNHNNDIRSDQSRSDQIKLD